MVSFDIRTSLYNVRRGGVRDYLSVGEDMLPVVYMVRAGSSRVSGGFQGFKGFRGIPPRLLQATHC